VAGVATVEDILEEIVGEIEDEFGLPDARIARLDDATVIAAGSLTIDDFNEMLGTHLPQGRGADVRGARAPRLRPPPSSGDSMTVAGAEIRVDSLDGLRITRLRVRVPD
jgi:putative hemolysin